MLRAWGRTSAPAVAAHLAKSRDHGLGPGFGHNCDKASSLAVPGSICTSVRTHEGRGISDRQARRAVRSAVARLRSRGVEVGERELPNPERTGSWVVFETRPDAFDAFEQAIQPEEEPFCGGTDVVLDCPCRSVPHSCDVNKNVLQQGVHSKNPDCTRPSGQYACAVDCTATREPSAGPDPWTPAVERPPEPSPQTGTQGQRPPGARPQDTRSIPFEQWTALMEKRIEPTQGVPCETP